jgi:hypothetical protein
LSLYNEILDLQGAGFSQEEIDAYAKEQVNVLSGAGFSEQEIMQSLGMPTTSTFPTNEKEQITTKTSAQPQAKEDDESQPSPTEEDMPVAPLPFLTEGQAFTFAEEEFGKPISGAREIQSYWQDVIKEVKEWSVGEKAEWGCWLRSHWWKCFCRWFCCGVCK